MNNVKIIKNAELKSKIFLNDVEIENVIDYRYNKTSAQDRTEVVIRFDADEIKEKFI